MNPRDHGIIEERKENLKRRLDRNNIRGDCQTPVFGDPSVRYEMAGRTRAVGCGGIGLVYRILGYNGRIEVFLRTFERIRRLKFT